ncbi:hypothetical protein [Actinomadura sp. 7K507]|uniref:hypothetical protein n=1 Tax=Actinomadura sp. 7K507 TaxID=2530365 RepID=UPI001404996B|nr:hypothetical protein [Actinomadura sp. 7K507]
MNRSSSCTRVPAGRFVAPAVLRPLEQRPIGTNGYVSSWGAINGICPPPDA